MTKMKTSAALISAMVFLTGCVTTGGTQYSRVEGPQPQYGQPNYNYAAKIRYATITSVTPVKDDSIGTGAVAGAVIGGVLGSTVGRGSGKTAATVAGAAAGGYVGHQVQKNNGGPDALEIIVRFDDGGSSKLLVDKNSSVRVGERIRLYQHQDGSIRTTP